MNIFDVIGYILRVKHKKVTKISILATQVYNICSLGGKLYVYPLIYQERLFWNFVILWELNGIKPAEKQYIIAVYQIDTNSISVQVWTLDFDGNISFNKNEIGGLTADQYANQLWYSAKEVFLQRNGLPIGTLFGYIEDGFYDNIAEVRADPIYAKASDDEARRMIGEIKYLDKNNDGKITSEDRAIIGDTNPDFIYGLNANLRWKNLTLGLFFQGTHGNDIFNGNLTNIGMSSIANITQDAYDSRWTPENAANAKWPRVTTAMTRDMKLSDRYVEDGSYFRLKTINLNYNFGSVIKGISNLSVFGTVTNVFTITGYSWFDPDVNAFGSDASRRGVDIFSYPSSRTYSIGFKLTL